jgi:DNA-binding GntR family transcriptional regulator
MDGLYEPGQVISLRSVARDLGTSPMPVREAMRRLNAEGALEFRSNRSIALPQISRKRFREITDLRVELETRATESAVREHGEILRPLLTTLEQRAKLARGRGLAERLSLNREFHFTIYETAGNELRTRLIELLWLQSAALTHVYFAKGPTKSQGGHHRQIIQAVRERKPVKAGKAMEDDIRETAEQILAFWRFPDDQPSP